MAVRQNFEPPHVGGFLKDAIIPDDTSVTDAVRLLGVGRPAVSQLLNERVSLSPEMALRFEKVLGVKMDTLLKMQATYDAWQMRRREAEFEALQRYSPA